MNLQLAEILVFSAAGYLAIGAVFAFAFVARGVERVDDAARASGWGFRLLLLPGSAVLWPWLARRWASGGPPREERNAHREALRPSRVPRQAGEERA
jgi:hypothetical protein